MTNLEKALDKIFGHEGGFQNHHNDRGNWTGGRVGSGELRGTKYGISAMSYPHLDIKNLTLEQASKIYRKDFWEPLRCDSLPYEVAFNLFDGAVNSGLTRSIKWMQMAADVEADGKIGPKTMLAWECYTPASLVARYNGVRLLYLASLDSWDNWGRGWAKRCASNLRETQLVKLRGENLAKEAPVQGTKSPTKSLTIWGGIVAIIAAIAGLRGYAIDENTQAELVALLTAIASGVGGIMAIIGRYRASKEIRSPGEPKLKSHGVIGGVLLLLMVLSACAPTVGLVPKAVVGVVHAGIHNYCVGVLPEERQLIRSLLATTPQGHQLKVECASGNILTLTQDAGTGGGDVLAVTPPN